MENKELYRKVLSFANEYPTCNLATAEGDQPRVRGMLMWFADETGFYFHTGSSKQIPGQIRENSKVEVAFVKQGTELHETRQLRVAGTVEILDDPALEERLHKERPWINTYKQFFPDEHVVMFRIRNGEAYIWSYEYNMREHEIERVKI